MGRTFTPTPCCSYVGLSKGPWTPEEDLRLIKYIEAHGEGNWRTLPIKAGLLRCGKGCRLRWMNYLRPNVKRGHISADEAEMIIRLHKLLGNRWSLIAGRIPGRTDNEVKNYWNTHLRKKLNATKSFTRYARALGGKQPNFELAASHKKKCRGGTINPLCMNEKGYSLSPYKLANSTDHGVKYENNGSACWDIREIVDILMGDEDICNRTEYVAIENFKKSIDGFHDTTDLNTGNSNDIHYTWPHGNQHPSSMPNIFSSEFEPYKICPSECMISGGLYQQYSMSNSFTSMGQQVDNFVSANIDSREKLTGDVSNLQPKTEAEAQIQIHIPPSGLIREDNSMAIECDVFNQWRINMLLPELGQNISFNSCVHPQDPTANRCSETVLSYSDCLTRDRVVFL